MGMDGFGLPGRFSDAIKDRVLVDYRLKNKSLDCTHFCAFIGMNDAVNDAIARLAHELP